MALTDTFAKNIKPTGSATGNKHTDGQGLYLHVKDAGKYWRMSYRFSGKQKTLALGVYPAVSLAKARQRRDKARELLADGIDPGTAAAPGTVVAGGRAEGLTVATGEGVLEVLDLQAEGGRVLPARDFLAGHPLPPGTRLDTP